MEKDGDAGNRFIVVNTSYAINNKDNINVGNYLKTFFVDYYDVAMEDKVKTQHIIWHFTDDFNGWRVGPELIKVLLAALKKVIPDERATLKLNGATEAVFYFPVLISHYPHHQNFFAYKIIYRNITNTTNITTENNKTNIITEQHARHDR